MISCPLNNVRVQLLGELTVVDASPTGPELALDREFHARQAAESY